LKSISTLISDIQARLTSAEPFEAETVSEFSKNPAAKLAGRLSEERGPPSLRLSNLGTFCGRKLWYTINTPQDAEPLSASTRLKFLFGDVLEEVLLFLSRAAGHTVTDEQKEVEINGVKGHIDAIVDGELVDVKSASTYSFNKFKTHGLVYNDDFGYRDQLGAYRSALGQDRAHFFAVDKTLGHIVLDTHTKEEYDRDFEKLVDDRRDLLAQPTPPDRAYADEADGKSGNRKLGVACSYCPFKRSCWPGLRSFSYSRGPVHLTKVERVPDVPELTGRNAEG